MLPELIATVAFPTVVLIGFAGEQWLGPRIGLVVALASPVAWGVFSMVRERQVSALAVIAVVSVVLTGSVGLFEVDPSWFALKEAAIPMVLGGMAIASTYTRYAFIPVFLNTVWDLESVDERLDAAGREAFDAACRRGTLVAGVISVVSGVVSWGLARYLVTSPSGTEAFAAELGAFTTVSFFTVNTPTLLATAWVIRGVLTKLEELTEDDVQTFLRSSSKA